METVMKIRRQILVDGKSVRSVSRETGLSRNTIRKYLKEDSPPTYRRQQAVKQPQLKGHQARLEQWYQADQQRPKRERRTAKKLFEQLQLEGYRGSYTTVYRFIKRLKDQVSGMIEAYVPLCFDAGDAMQFDWSQEIVILGGVETTVRIAHFRLAHSRQRFIRAYLRESQEMLLDAFNHALAFYQGVPKRVLIDNPKTMVVRIGQGKQRDFHPRFMALMNHYLMKPVACTPAAGWEKGQVENQVSFVRDQCFRPRLQCDDLVSLNDYLLACCHDLNRKKHPERAATIAEAFAEESAHLRPLGRCFDGYIEKSVKVSSTCLVRYDNHHYSVPSMLAGKRVSLRAYADRIVVVNDHTIVAEHTRGIGKQGYHFEPWHYVPLLERKPGALRNGAPFKQWPLPRALDTLKQTYLKRAKGDRDFVQLLLLIQRHGMDAVVTACELAIEQKTTQLSAIINLIHRLTESDTQAAIDASPYPDLQSPPVANCQRYDQLWQVSGGVA